jgi:hypothetical protein
MGQRRKLSDKEAAARVRGRKDGSRRRGRRGVGEVEKRGEWVEERKR